MTPGCRIGIDLGGTKIEGIVLDADGGMPFRERVTTPAGNYPATLRAMADLISKLERQCGQTCNVGVGTPGALSPRDGRIRNANSTCLNGKPLDRDLSDLLGRPVRLANDANCFTLSEARDGAAKGAASVFGVIIGTGTGGGIVINGQLLDGPNAIAGEWGHNPLPWPREGEWPGPPCYCGKTGCVETFLSGPGLARDFRAATGEEAGAPEIVSRAGRGEAAAGASLERYEDRMARALTVVLNIVDPDVVVLGGGMSQIARLYDTVPRIWQEWAFSDRVDTPLRPPVHGDSSGVRGAAWLWGEGEEDRV